MKRVDRPQRNATPFGTLLLFCLIAIGIAVHGQIGFAQTLDRIAATRTVRIGFIADQAPFASAREDREPAGYSIDLCRMIVQVIGARIDGIAIKYVEVTLADGFDAVAAGRIDLLCGAITATLNRREIVDFSEPFFVTGRGALLRKRGPAALHELFFGGREISPPRSLELTPFATLRIGVRGGTTTEAALRRAVLAGGYPATIVDFSAHSEGLAALEAGRIEAYFADLALLAELRAKAHDPAGLVIGTRLIGREPYAIAMTRGDADLRLLVDRALSRFYATPESAALLSKYFGGEAEQFQAQIRALSLAE